MTLTDLLKEWTAVHEERVGKTMVLQPISDEDLAAAEAGHGFAFPDDLRELLRYTNGIDHGWTGDDLGYEYFPRVWWEPVTAEQDWEVQEIADVCLGASSMEGRQGISPGNPDHVAVGQSARLMTSVAGDVYGIVLDGWAKGWIWQWLGGEDPSWYARSLKDLVSDLLEYERRGLLDWDRYGENIGCLENSTSPRVGFGHFSENGPGPMTPEMP